MDRRFFLGAALAAVASPSLAGTDVQVPTLRRPLSRPLPDPATLLRNARLGDASLGVAVESLNNASTGLTYGADTALPPASTLKAITALYALERLGEDFRFSTRVLRSGDTLILAGGGDPELDTDGLATLVKEAVLAAGDWKPARFAVWGGALPQVPQIVEGQAEHLSYNPALSGMILNFNRVHLGWRCDSSCSLSLEARSDGQSPRAYTVSAAVRPGSGAWRHELIGATEQWDIPRSALGKAGTRWLPVREPEAYAGDVFQTLARAQGLVLPTAERLDELEAGHSELARLDSRPLVQILKAMLEYSTNLTAEVVGLKASGMADLRSSANAMAEWLQDTGAGTAVFADHSGLSAESRISASAMVALLARPQSVSALRPILSTDPLRVVLGKEARGNGQNGAPLVSAKTGTLNFVSNLAGYAEGEAGPQAFAVMVANLPKRAATEGAELPDGVIGWTRRAKQLQRDVILTACHRPRLSPSLPPEI